MPFLGIEFPWETPAGEGFNWVGFGDGGNLDQPAPTSPTPSTRAQALIDKIRGEGLDLSDPVAAPGGGGQFSGIPGTQPTPMPYQGEYVPSAPAPPAEGENIVDRVISGVKSWATEQFNIGQPIPGPEDLELNAGTPVYGDWKAAAAGTAVLAGGALLASRLKAPWQTPEGEGWIAPWTQQQQLSSGLWGQEGLTYNGGGQMQLPSTAGMTMAQIGALPVRTWTNAARNGSSPATVQFIQFANGKIASQSLVSGKVSIWKPKKHIVISSNPRMSQIGKLDRVHTRVKKRLRKIKMA